ncbi:uncharacterized protein LOC9656039 isoform X2 [Selaginella moellendorffii]|uniref:uncharacterized protein LOC9656039 isoform X2 n=1 Tax=Selaginella moellendorffii TaxID=88036 RepID=UPI000D1CB74B|nr:uncharacterized protein LOC9656039 isoform X2 [Selaginella moellendorffii]|eukprot:XP_024516822.1 uncharacterized protein LOC9656039 isoform X2 [Selaginella moellendorffii]
MGNGGWKDGPQQQHHARGMKDINGESLVLFLWETLYALESNIYRREEPQHQSLAPTHAEVLKSLGQTGRINRTFRFHGEETCQVACKARRSYKKASFGTNPSLISARVCCDVAIPPVKGEFLVFLILFQHVVGQRAGKERGAQGECSRQDGPSRSEERGHERHCSGKDGANQRSSQRWETR